MASCLLIGWPLNGHHQARTGVEALSVRSPDSIVQPDPEPLVQLSPAEESVPYGGVRTCLWNSPGCTRACLRSAGCNIMPYARALKIPMNDDGSLCMVMHPFVFYDLLQASDVRNLAINSAKDAGSILFNGELAYWAGHRIVVTTNAKVFWGEGAAAATSLSTTLAAATSPGDTNIKVASVTTVNVGNWVAIRDATETGNTWTDTNEVFRVTAVGTTGAAGTGLTGYALDPGPGTGGGLRYAHASGITVNNSNSVYPLCVMGPQTITKAAHETTGPFGETVVSDGLDHLGRFTTLGWYLLAGWGRTWAPYSLRLEVGSSRS